MEFFSEKQVFIVQIGYFPNTFREYPTAIGILQYETDN